MAVSLPKRMPVMSFSIVVSCMSFLQFLYSFQQFALDPVLAVQRTHHPLVHGALRDEVIDQDWPGLPLTVEPGVRLLVELQVPCRCVPDDDPPALLHVEAVRN